MKQKLIEEDSITNLHFPGFFSTHDINFIRASLTSSSLIEKLTSKEVLKS